MHENPTDPFVRAARIVAIALLGIFAVWTLAPELLSRVGRVEAAPREVTPRGELTAEELSTIDIFERWKVEGGAPSALLRRGWTKSTLPPGTKVMVRGFQAKDGSPRADSHEIVFPDGTSMDLGGTRAED